MTTRDLRRKYLDFFASKGHTEFPSGSLIPYDVTGRLDESLLFNGAGMVQFKPYFRGIAEPPNKRLTTSQKCVRTGDIESVGDLTHLTFFEMLGNFSFGDYFKKDAVAYSWEFLTDPQWLGLDPQRLSFTVFSEDDEAYGHWVTQLSKAGIAPEHRIFRLSEETNYWPAGAFTNGPPGPCGPNSEMFYWTSNEEPPPTGVYTREDWIRDEEAGKWLEIWNDVFIQSEWQGRLRNPDRPNEGYIKEAMPDLPFQSIDTGMGLERTGAVLGGFRSVYDTDVFREIIATIEKLGGLKYGDDEIQDRAIRIISDHIRTACFCIADGILPGNTGRGYVLRRLIRRAVLKGLRQLGFDQPFFHLVYEGVRLSMADHYTELEDRRETIIETLRSEEELFRRTIRQGTELLATMLDRLQAEGLKTLNGESAFKLYDTFGFPLEVTQECCDEAGIAVDVEGYEAALKEAQDRSRGAHGMDTVYGGEEGGVILHIRAAAPQPTLFVGYVQPQCEATIVAAIPELDESGQTSGRFAVALDQTPFYAESGGQISDTGTLEGPGFLLSVVDLIKQDGIYVHLVEPLKTAHPQEFKGLGFEELQNVLIAQFFGKPVVATVDAPRRMRIMRNHTATHLLHAALRSVLGNHVTQAGSLVAPDHLRFDFTHGRAMTPEEIAEVERRVNEATLAANLVEIHDGVPIAQAKAMGAMALFGEKYGDTVRMVEIKDWNGSPVSVELCGGCHVGSTGQIGMFKIVHESSAASGVRRIEAITGEGAIAWANEQASTLREASELLKSQPAELVHAIEKTLATLKEERKKREKMAQQAGSDEAKVSQVGPVSLAVMAAKDLESKEAQAIADRLVDNDTKRVAVVAVQADGKALFVVKAGKEAVTLGVHAGNLVKELAAMTGGGGGGRPDFATAGGRDLSKFAAAVEAAERLLAAQLKL